MEKGEVYIHKSLVHLYNENIKEMQHMRVSVYITILLLSTMQVWAQFEKRDSLLRLVPVAKEDTSAVLLYLGIGDLYEGDKPEEAKKIYQKAYALSNKIKFNKGIIKSLTYYGGVCSLLGQYDSSIFYGQKALAKARIDKDTLNIGIGLMNIGATYGFKADYQTAIEYCLEGLKIVEGRKYNNIELQINDKLQVLYMQMGQYDKAIIFGQKAVQQSRQLKMTSFLAQTLSNLSMSYTRKRMPEKAVPLLNEALGISKQLGNINMEASILLNLADVSLSTGNYNVLKRNCERSLILSRKLGSLETEAISLRALSIYYLHNNNFSKSRQLLEESISISKKNNFKREYASALNVFSNLSFAMGDLDAGEKYFRQSEDILGELIDGIISEKSVSLEKKYETEKKAAQIKQLETEMKVQQLSLQKKNVVNLILLGSALTLLIISLLSYRNYKQKQKLQLQRISELETENQLSAAEAVVKGEEQERTRLAKDLHDGLGGMLSGIKHSFTTMKGNLVMTPENHQAFERSLDMLDSSISEMRRVAHNMMPEALVRFGLDTALKDFCNDINQSGALKVNYHSMGIEGLSIDSTTSITLYRIVQELLNNAMKHAQATSAIVQVTNSNGQLSVTVEDDGKGFDTSILKLNKGMGWANIRNRVDFLKGRLDIRSKQGEGTSVQIELNA